MNLSVLSVSALNTYIKSIVESDGNLFNVFVEGEISNFKNHYASGHLYFSLKDEKSVIRCVMFSSFASRLRFEPQNSMHVICRGRIAVYERDGQYQLYPEDMQPVGIGALALKYEQLKQKLLNEGLFSVENKRPLPRLVKRIAVVTSETGAAVHDILSILERRAPFVEVVFCKVLVQGEAAAESMCKALEKLYETNDIDLIIIGRGGGSFEDLFCFNDEKLVRKICESPIPIISAVGHETDVTLCDLAADLRAPTPSAAAELATAEAGQIVQVVESAMPRIENAVLRKIEQSAERLDRVLDSNVFSAPREVFAKYNHRFGDAVNKLWLLSLKLYIQKETKFLNAAAKIEALNPMSVLLRGYAGVSKDGNFIVSANEINKDDILKVDFHDGSAECLVKNVEIKEI